MKSLFAVCLFAACSLAVPRALAQSAEANPLPNLIPGQKAPALSPDIAWIKGAPVTTFEPGKVYLVELWATWCGPCVGVIPKLTHLQQKYGDKLVVIGLTAPDKFNTPQAVRKFVTARGDGMGYRVGMDERSYYTYLGQRAAIPQSFVIGQDGVILYDGGMGNLDQVIEAAVAGQTLDQGAANARADELRKTNGAMLRMIEDRGRFTAAELTEAATRLSARIPRTSAFLWCTQLRGVLQPDGVDPLDLAALNHGIARAGAAAATEADPLMANLATALHRALTALPSRGSVETEKLWAQAIDRLLLTSDSQPDPLLAKAALRHDRGDFEGAVLLQRKAVSFLEDKDKATAASQLAAYEKELIVPLPASDSDDYALFTAQRLAPVATPAESADLGGYLLAEDQARRRLQTAGFEFIQRHPADPRRWQVVVHLLSESPCFLTALSPGAGGDWAARAKFDAAARANWADQAREMRERLLAAPDSSPAQREAAAWTAVLPEAGDTLAASVRPELKAQQAKIDAHLAAHAAAAPAVLVSRVLDHVASLAPLGLATQAGEVARLQPALARLPLPDTDREWLDWISYSHRAEQARAAQLPELAAAFDAHFARYSREPLATWRINGYLQLVERVRAGAGDDERVRLFASNDRTVIKTMQPRIRILAAQRPGLLDFKIAADDGSQIDTAAMRGKPIVIVWELLGVVDPRPEAVRQMLAARVPRDAEVITVSLPTDRTAPAPAPRTNKFERFIWIKVDAPDEILIDRLGVRGFPLFQVIDRAGKLVGQVRSSADVEKTLDDMRQ